MRGLFVVLFAALGLVGCGQKDGGGGDRKFLLPWPDANGNYRLQEVTIETLADPAELRGEAAEVFSRAAFSASGFNGSLARPHLTKSGEVYVPLDTESSTAVSIYAQFDRLFKFEGEIGSRGQLNWPRRVGIETALTGTDSFRHNNAHYFTNLDVIGVVPFTLDEKVPVAMNHGILAHEHFHAHFQAQVLNVINRAKPQPIVSALEQIFNPFPLAGSAVTSFNPGSTRDLNDLVLRAWNEGLADLYAAIYVGKSDFFSPSMPALAGARNLDASPELFWNAASLRPYANRKLSDEEIAGIAYPQGTNLARIMFSAANNGREAPKKFLARVLGRLSNIAQAAGTAMDSRVMDFEEVVPVLLEGYELNASVCDDLSRSLMKSTLQRSFAKCGF